MNPFISAYNRLKVFLREQTNPLFGGFRMKSINNHNFTIISNNCWAGHVYRYFNLPYNTPTIGLYFFSEDYIKFLSNLKYYIDADLQFISYTDSMYRNYLEARGEIHCPIGRLNDIEVIFLHYSTPEEALTKWNRRKKRICWDNLIYKMSEQNLCSIEHLKMFDSIPEKKKFVFTTKNYGLKSQVIFEDFYGDTEVSNDTLSFRKYVDLIKLINGEPFQKHQSKVNE